MTIEVDYNILNIIKNKPLKSMYALTKLSGHTYKTVLTKTRVFKQKGYITDLFTITEKGKLYLEFLEHRKKCDELGIKLGFHCWRSSKL